MSPTAIIRAVYGCVLLSLLALAYWLGGQSVRADFADYRTKVMASTAKAAQLATKASELARKAEHAHAGAIASIAEQYEVEKREIEQSASILAAELRAGNRRLHQRWQAALATSELSGTAASSAESDAAAADREGSAARIIAAADQCDAQVRGLQEVVQSDRK